MHNVNVKYGLKRMQKEKNWGKITTTSSNDISTLKTLKHMFSEWFMDFRDTMVCK